ncbi:MAG TPA: hypothetical protein V6D47_15335 [Oscillatoriaceae cyanobacterium]
MLLRRDPASYTDPNGFVFWQEDQVYRRIYRESAAYFRELLRSPAIAALQEAGHLVPTTFENDGDELLLRHETIWPLSYPHEWCAPMLRDAALLTLEVASTLAASGQILADGHPWNVLFRAGRPVFIDWGSITPPSDTLIWPAAAQFQRFQLYPLHLYAAGQPELARARLADLALGVSADLALRALPLGYKLAHPIATAKLKANQAAERMAARWEPRQATASRPVNADTLQTSRRFYFAGLEREVAAMPLERAASRWADYYAACPSMDAEAAAKKQHLVAGLFEELKPASIVDLGTNTGQYALMAARAGARVVAVDQDPASIAALYAQVRAEKLDVLPLVMDLGNPSGANGWCAEQRPDAPSRLRADLSLMLALIHHLVFTGNVNFQQIARMASLFSRRHTLIEWVAPEDPMALHLRRTATKDFGFYRLEGLCDALTQEGFEIRLLEPHAETRRLLLATRRN